MTVSEFIKAGNVIFSMEVLEDFPTVFKYVNDDSLVLNTLFSHNYGSCPIDVLTQEELDLVVRATFMKRLKYYEALTESLDITFDPLDTINITEAENSTEQTNQTNNKTMNGTQSEKTASDASRAEQGGNVSNQTQTGSEGSKTAKNTYDSATLNITDTLDTNNTNSSEIKTNSNNTSSDTMTAEKDSNSTNTENAEQKTTAQGTTTRTRKGHDTINYEDAVASIYKTKMLNIYDIAMSDVFAEVCVPLYIF